MTMIFSKVVPYMQSTRISIFLPWDPFLESPGNLTGPVSYFEIKISRKVCCVLTSNEAHFVSLANSFTFSKLLKLPFLMENKTA